MKSRIKPSGESVCTGGNKNEAWPAGNSIFHLIPLPPSPPHYHYPVHRSHTQFPLISLPDDPPRPAFLLSFQPLYLFSNYFLSPFLSCFSPLPPPACFGVFDDLKMAHLAAFRLLDRAARLRERQRGRDNRANPPSSQRLSHYSITP